MIKEVDQDAVITIATSASQISQIKNQLGDQVGVSVEPMRRDTFPAIALASAYLKRIGVVDNAPVIVCPVDPYVEKEYFECLKEMSDQAGKANLTLMGIEPTYPSEKYGYIIPKTQGHIAQVKEFKEKPDISTAEKYIREGALWNGGVFAFQLSYVLGITKQLIGTDDYDEIISKYDTFPKISFDYAIAEKEKSINVIRFAGLWKDLGTWNTLSETMDEAVTGNAVAVSCTNTHLINELGIPLVALGIDNAIIAATPDGILVSDKEKSPQIKNYVVDNRPMYERRNWGEYKVLEYKVHQDEQNSLVKELVISSGEHISYHRHKYRTEIWTFTEGKGLLILDGEEKYVKRGDVAVICPGKKHAIKATEGELHVIEVQIGNELTEEDIERLDWNW